MQFAYDNEMFKTKTVASAGKQPEWNETFVLQKIKDHLEDELVFVAKDEDVFSADLLGETKAIPLFEILIEIIDESAEGRVVFEKALPLLNKDRERTGEVLLRFAPLEKDKQVELDKLERTQGLEEEKRDEDGTQDAGPLLELEHKPIFNQMKMTIHDALFYVEKEKFGKLQPFVAFDYKRAAHRTSEKDEWIEGQWKAPTWADEFMLEHLDEHMLDKFQFTAGDPADPEVGVGVCHLGRTDFMKYRLINTINKMQTFEPVMEQFELLLDGQVSGLLNVEFQGIDDGRWAVIQQEQAQLDAQHKNTINKMTRDTFVRLTINQVTFLQLGEDDFGYDGLKDPFVRFVHLDQVYRTDSAKSKGQRHSIFNQTFELKAFKQAATARQSLVLEAHDQDEHSATVIGWSDKLGCYEHFCREDLAAEVREDIPIFDKDHLKVGIIAITFQA